MTKSAINRAIKHLGIEIQGNRRDGYFYFTSIKYGDQVGESVYVCYLKHLTLEKWIECANNAIKENELDRNLKIF